ncbi:glycosyltransferase family 39 protein [Sporolactobacillus pectinivorans]|uniref:glycosyltransferase family 39 protein n=1 Tax=Sporolactobacillus pectinivorans TaxID=1591408 RepID=UPI0012FE0234|nr:glycosyltransferase family 39 protein [Sporolactobacillus pectinivorans]
MILRLRRGLLSVFNNIFAACFFIVLVISLSYSLLIKSGKHITSTSLSLLLFSAIVILFFVTVYRFLSKLTLSSLKKVTLCLGAAILLVELAIIVFFHSIVPPVMDGGHTYGEALYLLAHGHASGDSYFKVYPNNIPVTVIRYWIYHFFVLIHVSDYTIIDQLSCTAVLNISIYFSWKLVLRLFDAKLANMFLLMTLTCFPLFFYITYFYTDTMTLMFPALLLYLWYLYHRSMKIRYLVLSGLLLGIGYQIRPNLILFLPALVIYMFFVLKMKKVLLNLAVIAMIMAAVSFSVHAYDRHLGYTPDPALSMPSVHWIMLGLSQYGEYNIPDFNLTRSQPTQQAKIRVDLQQIKSRIVQKKAPGLIYLWVIKTAITWGMGARGYDIYTQISQNPTTAYEYLFGHQDQLMLYITQIFHIVNIFFVILSSMNYMRTKKISMNLLIQICLFGNFIFYTFFWESEPRYSLLFTPFMLISAVFGFNELIQMIHSPGPVLSVLKKRSKMPTLLLTGSLLAGVAACAWINMPGYTERQMVQKHYIVDQETAAGVQSAFVDAHHMVRQSFRATGPFTDVSMSILSRRGRGVYNMSLMNLSRHKVIFSKNFSSAQARPWYNLTFSVNKDQTRQRAEDQITIRQISGNSRARLGLSLYGNGYDRGSIYSGGRFMENGSVVKNAELRFQVYSIQERSYLSRETYFLLFSMPVLMLIFYAYVSLKYDGKAIEAASRAKS